MNDLFAGEIEAVTLVINMAHAPAGWKDRQDFVYCGRAGKGYDGYFGNPYRLNPDEPRSGTLAQFETYARARVDSDAEYRKRVKSLHGKYLVCFCAPKKGLTIAKPWRCHCQVLAQLAFELQEVATV